jgi:hypothetical protein
VSIEHLFSGKGAKEVRVVWGTFRGRPHAYRFNYFGEIGGHPFGSVSFITLCDRAITPKGHKTTKDATAPTNACAVCAEVAKTIQSKGSEVTNFEQRLMRLVNKRVNLDCGALHGGNWRLPCPVCVAKEREMNVEILKVIAEEGVRRHIKEGHDARDGNRPRTVRSNTKPKETR